MIDDILLSIQERSTTVIAVIAVIAVSILLYQLAKRGLHLMLKKGALAGPVASTLSVLLRWSFVIVTLLLVLQQFGVLQNVWAALLAVAATIAIGFVASWSILSNVFCTLLVLIYRPFKIGDTIDVPADNVAGEVIDINFMYATLKNEKGLIIQIPNNTFFTKPIIRTLGNHDMPLHDQLQSDKPFEV